MRMHVLIRVEISFTVLQLSRVVLGPSSWPNPVDLATQTATPETPLKRKPHSPGGFQTPEARSVAGQKNCGDRVLPVSALSRLQSLAPKDRIMGTSGHSDLRRVHRETCRVRFSMVSDFGIRSF